MFMTLNDVLTKQSVLTKVLLKDEDKELSKALKVKIMRLRMSYNKIKKNFDSEVQEFVEELMTPEFKELSSKVERTELEETRLKDLTTSINSDYYEFILQKGKEEVDFPIDDKFSLSDYEEIVDVNVGNDVEINGNKISAVDLLEIIYDLFVVED